MSSNSYESGAQGDFIPLSVPVLQGNEWQYVKECLDTGWVSSVGSYVDRFEADVARFVDVEHAVAATSGTAALHIALLVAGVQPQDEVLVSTLSFIAPANAIRYVGAWPVFMDAEPQYWQMDVEQAVAFLENYCTWHDGDLRNNTTGRRIKAIVPVHILGHPVDLDPLLEVAAQYNLAVIEDATECIGTKYKERMVGSLGHLACFSFNGNKIITAGGGGMLVTNNAAWAQKAKYLTTQAKDDPLEYVHHHIGYNYRLTNIQAALGVAQLEQLPKYMHIKQRIAERYTEAFTDVEGITVMLQAEWAESNWWLYTILVDEAQFGISSRQLLRKLAAANIQTRPLWQPLHMSKAHHDAPRRACPVAERLWKMSLSLPCSVNLTEDEQKYVIQSIMDSTE